MYTAGIDIGGTNTRIALIDEAYEIIQRIQFPTDVNNPQATLQKFRRRCRAFPWLSQESVYPVRVHWI